MQLNRSHPRKDGGRSKGVSLILLENLPSGIASALIDPTQI